ncbi:DUF397 domain-containing protein [Actinomadura sp. KC06]|nr:DUF397 domain-containing protein [Actinomadura sp. KC06]
MTRASLGRVIFRKSSQSEGANGCVETCVRDSRHLVRDSKNPQWWRTGRGAGRVGRADVTDQAGRLRPLTMTTPGLA